MDSLATARRPCRLHPDAAYVTDLGYVFIDLNGRLYRMDVPDFEALRERCIAGLTPDQRRALGGLLQECPSASLAEASFANQELIGHES